MAKRINPVVLFVLLPAFLAPLGCGRSKAPEAPTTRQKAPNFELTDLAGKKVRLSDYQGKVVLLDFWATYCDPCHDSIPMFERFYEENRTQGLEVVGVSLDVDTSVVPDFVKKNGVQYAIVLDPTQSTPASFGVRGMPTTLLVDRAGNVRRRWLGFDPQIGGEIRSEFERALREKA